MQITKSNLHNQVLKEADWRFRDLFQYGPVEYVWGLWWYRVFQVPSLHDTLLSLLINCINEPSFVKESQKFGQTWIEHCVQQEAVVREAINLSHRVFCQTPEVAKVSQDLCIWFVQQSRV